MPTPTRVALALLCLTWPAAAQDPFTVTGPGKPGTGGLVPVLSGSGPGTPGSEHALLVEQTQPNGSGLLVVGVEELAAPLLGGLLGPRPDLLLPLPVASAQGTLARRFVLPGPPLDGGSLWFQAWLDDPGGLGGLSASNTLRLDIDAPPPWDMLLPLELITEGAGPRDVALEDLDGDGRLDLVVTHSGTGLLLLRPGLGDGQLGQAQALALPGPTRALLVTDIDRDTQPDLVLSQESGDLLVLRNTGALSFAPPLVVPMPFLPLALVAADLDGDGWSDLVVGSFAAPDNPIAVIANQGGSLGPAVQVDPPQPMFSLAAADMDGDGDDDLVGTSTLGFGHTLVLLGDDAESLELGALSTIGGQRLVVGDVDGDGDEDVVLALNSTLGVLPNTGDGSLGALISSPDVTAGFVRDMALLDLDGDGHLDVAAAGGVVGTVSAVRGRGDGHFVGPVDHGVAAGLSALAAGDLDGDGAVDLAVANEDSDGVSLLEGQGDGTFRGTSLRVRARPGATRTLAIDLDLDGHLDLVTASHGSSGPLGVLSPEPLAVSLGHGDGQFDEPVFTSLGEIVTGVVSGDLDGDGTPDLVASLNHDTVLNHSSVVLLGDGAGGLAPGQELIDQLAVSDLELADLDGDGQLDLLVAPPEPFSLSVRRGRGDGTFEPPQTHAAGFNPSALELADLDLDGDLDVVVANHSPAPSGLTVLAGDGTGQLATPVPHPAGDQPSDVAIADLDHDGWPDLICVHAAATQPDVAVLRGLGDLAFAPASFEPIEAPAGSVAVADLDGDGWRDVVVSASAGQRGVELLLGSGAGGLQSAGVFGGGELPASATLADVDEDGRLDLLIPSVLSADVTVLLQAAGTQAAEAPGEPSGPPAGGATAGS